MSTPYIGELRVFSFGFAPKGWVQCNGQLMSIQQNTALFAILGTTYGGDGVRTFGLPNLQGRTPVHVGNGIVLGQLAGEQAHTLLLSEMAAHTHVPAGTNTAANQGAPTGNLWATETENSYATTVNSAMLPAAIGNTGGSQPHNNMQPYLVLNVCIAIVGIFPTRN